MWIAFRYCEHIMVNQYQEYSLNERMKVKCETRVEK